MSTSIVAHTRQDGSLCTGNKMKEMRIPDAAHHPHAATDPELSMTFLKNVTRRWVLSLLADNAHFNLCHLEAQGPWNERNSS